MKADTKVWYANCTKTITAIACMQMVEKWEPELDNAEQIYKICPEFRDLKCLDGDGRLVEKGDILFGCCLRIYPVLIITSLTRNWRNSAVQLAMKYFRGTQKISRRFRL